MTDLDAATSERATLNDSKETRAIYRATGGPIETAELTYTAAGGRGAKRAGEIIVKRL